MSSRLPVVDRIHIKRVYDAALASDGKRILIDRLWPRGVSKTRADLFDWCKEIAPSDELRRWFHADPTRWDMFVTRYRAELAQHDKLLGRFADYASEGEVTLIYAARDEIHNHAIVLRDYLRQWMSKNEGLDKPQDST